MIDKSSLTLNMEPLIRQALREDISQEDVSASCVLKGNERAKVQLICKEDGILCGMDVFKRVFEILNEDFEIDEYFSDGDKVKNRDLIADLRGDAKTLLSGERTALNYLQRMSGIASYTKKMTDKLKGTNIKILDTRKTSPNNRIFEKYAVKTGGGYNHRYNLSDGVLLKDNHIGAAGGIGEAIKMAKEYAPFVRKIEIEVESPEGAREAVEGGADIIMLDNMNRKDMEEAIRIIGKRAEIEVSGNVTDEMVDQIKDLSIDYISSGALTHSAPILDLSMKNLKLI